MGVAVVDDREPDLRQFDLEYSELIGCEVSGDRSEIELMLRCSTWGWRWRTFVGRMLSKVGFDANLYLSPAEFDVSLRMIDVSTPMGLTSTWDPGTQVQLFKQGAPVIVDFRNIVLRNGRYKFFMEIDDGTLEFEYAQCIQRQVGRSF